MLVHPGATIQTGLQEAAGGRAAGSTIYVLIGVILSAIVFAAIAVALAPIGMPALTAPFVLTTWVYLLPMAGFRALERVSVAECASTSSLVRLRTPELTRAE